MSEQTNALSASRPAPQPLAMHSRIRTLAELKILLMQMVADVDTGVIDKPVGVEVMNLAYRWAKRQQKLLRWTRKRIERIEKRLPIGYVRARANLIAQ